MGEFTTGDTPENTAKADSNLAGKGVETDVKGVSGDDTVKMGSEEFPVFDVPENEFYQNMQWGRRRMRFSGKTQEYMQNTKYNRPFFVRHTDAKGKQYVRKVK